MLWKCGDLEQALPSMNCLMVEAEMLQEEAKGISQNNPIEMCKKLKDPCSDVPYTEEELYMMSHLIGAEAGETEKSRQLVGLLALNRVLSSDPNFPDTLKEVIFQKGQYACTWDGGYEKEPNQDEIESAKKVLSGNADYELPPDVIFQSLAPLGTIHEKTWSEVMQNWTYFCSPY